MFPQQVDESDAEIGRKGTFCKGFVVQVSFERE